MQTIYRCSAYSCETELYGTCKCEVKLLEMISVDLAFTSISFYCDANGKYSQLATCRSTCNNHCNIFFLEAVQALCLLSTFGPCAHLSLIVL